MPQPRSRSNAARLMGLSVALAATWLVVLPWLGRQPAVRAHIERNESQGIDPTAKFYTETESTRHALTRLHSLERREPGALWAASNQTGAPGISSSRAGLIDED